jgi:hypothetical protein
MNERVEISRGMDTNIVEVLAKMDTNIAKWNGHQHS